jgi:hypothetical protein
MKIFLEGVEYKSYRKILEDLEAPYGCINYDYIFNRTPRFSVSDCRFEELMAHPGGLQGDYAMEYYAEWLNNNAEYISFALVPHELEDCSVKQIPFASGREYYVSYELTQRPFTTHKYITHAQEGHKIHGFGFQEKYMESCNIGIWMRGRAGIISDCVKGKMYIRMDNTGAYRMNVARKHIKNGRNIDLMKIKQRDWKEIAKINCLSWLYYQEVLDAR